MRVEECIATWTSGVFSDSIIVAHRFNPKHDAIPWRWEESICLYVTCDLPEDLVDDPKELIDEYSGKRWNGLELYELLSDRGISGVDFTDILFKEFSMRMGDSTHKVALHQIDESKLADKYGPN